ncbi:hypothetical protein MXAN_5233 [Myxococcus xanthus DK 1622]|uniref:Uncharacterized protein n=1 Tax=Myxococcus xanthus (strain DK1622) TaxID=246197 RepID=Q1D1T8_MYXXD|nr:MULTISPECIES: hypothetical protein [Myxococcus]ABF87050.1 hypothetical protein MXAN_5233 [Myxococcus xanthus DK 1622]QZZ52898.1 hypothetical protein MyxoNM_27165 [Myxococcus xanthus]UYI12595.1 hypothetical protein N3T43_26475 [Myxococcus xanthus]UYI19963.1 hypothetical protein N1129_26925 [Myxococcus xanthus]SDY03774.1 hypothetical protein SAMN05444383_11718 [Myxococcus xanthus]
MANASSRPSPLLSRPSLKRVRDAANLLASLAPGVLFVMALLVVSQQTRFSWLAEPLHYPWEFWVVGLAGTTATAAGVADWRYHRVARLRVGPREHQAEFLALAGGGLPLFLLMCAASVAHRPQMYLLPVLVVLIGTVALICYDEFVFHRRRCDRWEALLHRTLLAGHAAAFLAWAHFCFVRENLRGG